MERLHADAGSIRFLGTIIAVQGNDLVTVQAPLDRELPPRVVTIIDGQQRPCTLVVLTVLLHDALSGLVRATAEDEHEAVVWVREAAAHQS